MRSEAIEQWSIGCGRDQLFEKRGQYSVAPTASAAATQTPGRGALADPDNTTPHTCTHKHTCRLTAGISAPTSRQHLPFCTAIETCKRTMPTTARNQTADCHALPTAGRPNRRTHRVGAACPAMPILQLPPPLSMATTGTAAIAEHRAAPERRERPPAAQGAGWCWTPRGRLPVWSRPASAFRPLEPNNYNITRLSLESSRLSHLRPLFAGRCSPEESCNSVNSHINNIVKSNHAIKRQ